MLSEDISLVRTSAAAINSKPGVGALVDAVLRHLEDAQPDLPPMIDPNGRQRRERLMKAFSDVCRGLGSPDALARATAAVARPAIARGATHTHALVFTHAVLDGLKDVSGFTWTNELASAWSSAMETTLAAAGFPGAGQADEESSRQRRAA